MAVAGEQGAGARGPRPAWGRLCAWGAACLLGLPAPAVAAGIGAPADGVREAFCTGLAGIVAAERAREAGSFAADLAQAPDVVRGERRVESDAVLTPDEAEVVAERLWGMWAPTAPAGSVAVVEDTPDAWVLAPAPGPDEPPVTDPIRIDKRTGTVAWRLPHPSEREQLHAAMCAPGG
jgi:hypothetical protein